MLIDFRTLFPKYNIKPKGVLHVGGNVGEEAPVYRELGIENQIWIEANPIMFYKLQQNLKGFPLAKSYNYCISDKREKIKFNISNNGSQSSSILELGTHLIVHPEVHYIDSLEMESFTLKEILMSITYQNTSTMQYEGGYMLCDLLNIDIQGAELKALKGLEEFLNNFKWAYLEVNKEELYKGCALVGEIDDYMNEFGFIRVETLWCGNTGWGDALYIK